MHCMSKVKLLITHIYVTIYLNYCSRFLTQCFCFSLMCYFRIRLKWNQKTPFPLYKVSSGSQNLCPWVLQQIPSIPRTFASTHILWNLCPHLPPSHLEYVWKQMQAFPPNPIVSLLKKKNTPNECNLLIICILKHIFLSSLLIKCFPL